MGNIPVLRELPDAAGDQPASLTTTTRGAPEGSEKLLVLSRDQGLIDTLQVVGFPNEVEAVAREAELASVLYNEQAAVVLLDTAAVSQPIDHLTDELRAQFPDLVLIVAGGQADQIALAAQITDGTVYRFLAKPVSPQRIKLFLDAAWRRRGEQSPTELRSPRPQRRTTVQSVSIGPIPTLPTTPSSGRRNTWLMVTIVAAGVAIGGLYFHRLRTPSPPVPNPAGPGMPPPASAASSLDDLITHGQAALARGDLDDAGALYREAQRISPDDPRVVSGLGQIVQKLLATAQAQLKDGNIDQAQQLTRQAWSLEPDNREVAQLLTHEARVRPAPTAEAPAVTAPAITAPAAAPPERSAERKASPRVEEYLRLAQAHIRQGSLIDPPDGSARYYLSQARALAPGDPAVRQTGRQLAEAVAAEARQALASNRLDDADRWIAAASDLGARPEELASLTRESQRARAATQADVMSRTATLFDQRLTQGKLLEPPNDSAKFYLAQLIRSAPNQPAAQLARTAFQQRLLAEAQNATRNQDYTGAERWIAAARDAGADSASITAAESDIQAAQARARATPAAQPARAPAPVQLTRVYYVDPQVPDAFSRLRGSVLVAFTIRPDGTTTDIKIESAEPRGVFDRATIEAVGRWRYLPPQQDGHPTTVRTEAHLTFNPSN